jgi:TRAP-type C4-dicarboxylate transport system permease small subunit
MIRQACERVLHALILSLGLVAGFGILGMMAVTCADIALRAFGQPIRGSYDLIRILSVLTLAGALPYTTAVKGHVAVEYFFHKLPAGWRLGVDSVMRLLMIGLLGLFAWQGITHGAKLQASGELMATLHLPVFWMPWVIALSCAVSALVVGYHLLAPGRALLRP